MSDVIFVSGRGAGRRGGGGGARSVGEVRGSVGFF